MGPPKKRQRMASGEAGDVKTQLSKDVASTPRKDGEVPIFVSTQSKAERQPSKQLFVRSLPSSVTQDRLTEHFSQSYPIKHALLVCDPATKKSKGYGFVTFADLDDARQVKEEFNGSLFEGQKIKVDFAERRHRTEETGRTTNDTSKGLPTNLDPDAAAQDEHRVEEMRRPPKLIIRNLPWTVKEPEQLAVLFRSYGKVKHATLPKQKPGVQAGFGFVVLRGYKNAEKAIQGVNGKFVDGRPVAVDWAVEKDVWEGLQRQEKASHEKEVDGQVNDESDDAGVKDIGARLYNDQEEEEDDGEDENGSSIPRSCSDNQEGPDEAEFSDEPEAEEVPKMVDNSSTIFLRNVPYTATDDSLYARFKAFGPVRYARVVVDPMTERPRGTGFVCFYKKDDADACLRGAPRPRESNIMLGAGKKSGSTATTTKFSVLQDELADPAGRYTLEGRVLQLSRAVNRDEAVQLTEKGNSIRTDREHDKRRLYLLSEGTLVPGSALYHLLTPTEIRMRETSLKQRKSIVKSNPSLHLSLTRLSIRNIPRTVTSKDLKALAREAVVGFAMEVKSKKRLPLSKEELDRGGEDMKRAERERKEKGKGIVKQAKLVFEGREGGKVSEDSGAGRSRGYGFIEYTSHRWALMGLRWLNGHAVNSTSTDEQMQARMSPKKRLIVEFAIENAQVVARRKDREVKARERSQQTNVTKTKGTDSGKISNDVTAVTPPTGATRGKKRKWTRVSKESKTTTEATSTAEGESKDHGVRLAKRQQIIAKKRMQRRSRKKNVAA